MEILGQSTKAMTQHPYVHLGYLAANNSRSSLIKSSIGISCLFIITVLFMIIKRSETGRKKIVKDYIAAFFIVLAILVVIGMGYPKSIYYPSQSLYQVTNAILSYAKEHDGNLSVTENWCDELIMRSQYNNVFSFEGADLCPEGESGFALNVNIIGKKLSDLSSDTVLLFETDKGVDVKGRTGFLKERVYFKSVYEENSDYFMSLGDIPIYPDRWNQVGGSEILTTKYNDGKGCDVAFVDGHAEFVRTEDIPELRWHPDEVEMPLGQ